jgi:hypothetical protein
MKQLNAFCLMRVSRLALLNRSIEKTHFPVIPWFAPLITGKCTFQLVRHKGPISKTLELDSANQKPQHNQEPEHIETTQSTPLRGTRGRVAHHGMS